MRVEQIVYLNEIHKQMSLHKAAENLHLSPQALSLSMNTLEQELEMELLIRTKSGTFLTKQGMQVLSAGCHFIEALHNIKNAKEETYPELASGVMKLAMTSGITETLYPVLVSQLFAEYPNLKVVSEKLRMHEIVAGTALREAELGLVYQVAIDQDEAIDFDHTAYQFVPIQPGRYCCLAHRKFAVCRYKRVSLKTIAEYPVIVYKPTRLMLQSILDHAGEKVHVIEVEDFSVYRQMLRDGNGLGLYVVLTSAGGAEIDGDLKLIDFKENVTSSMGYIYHRGYTLSAQALAFSQYLQDFCSKHMDKSLSIL